VSTAQREFDKAREYLGEAARRFGDGGPAAHPFFARLQAQIEQDSGNLDKAYALTLTAVDRFANARALRRLKAELLIQQGRFDEAIAFLEEEKQVYRADPSIWQALAQAHFANESPGLAHWATAEQYALLGAWRAVRSQLRLAQRDPKLDFYRLSQIDARLRVVEALILRERERER